MDLNDIRNRSSDYFGISSAEAHFFFAPGRVCLIGEHIDYNGGSVLPAALSIGVYAVFMPNNSHFVRIRSALDSREITFTPDEPISFNHDNGWGNYPLGVIKYLHDLGLEISGGDLYFESDLPTGAGLSSSAAIEVLTAYLFLSMQDKSLLSNEQIALLCQRVENEFIGVQCGIMDQFAVAMGKKNQAMKLDCSNLSHEYVPVNLMEYELVIFNTNKSRELTTSLFNKRAEECAEAFENIVKYKEIESLVDAHMMDVDRYIEDPVIRKRAKHVITENKRVLEAVDALKRNDMKSFGSLLFKAHESLKNNYEVTGLELDAIEEAMRNHPAVVGGKMSGAGFGGCAFAIVERNKVMGVIKYVQEEYNRKTGLPADYYIASIEDGVRRIMIRN